MKGEKIGELLIKDERPSENSQELDQLRDLIDEMQEELDYGKQRENKLMFFLFVLKEKGFPISEVFEEEIKDILTTRFSTQFDDEYKSLYEKITQERKDKNKQRQLEEMTYRVPSDFIPMTERVFMNQKPHQRSRSASFLNESCYPLTQEAG